MKQLLKLIEKTSIASFECELLRLTEVKRRFESEYNFLLTYNFDLRLQEAKLIKHGKLIRTDDNAINRKSGMKKYV